MAEGKFVVRYARKVASGIKTELIQSLIVVTALTAQVQTPENT